MSSDAPVPSQRPLTVLPEEDCPPERLCLDRPEYSEGLAQGVATLAGAELVTLVLCVPLVRVFAQVGRLTGVWKVTDAQPENPTWGPSPVLGRAMRITMVAVLIGEFVSAMLPWAAPGRLEWEIAHFAVVGAVVGLIKVVHVVVLLSWFRQLCRRLPGSDFLRRRLLIVMVGLALALWMLAVLEPAIGSTIAGPGEDDGGPPPMAGYAGPVVAAAVVVEVLVVVFTVWWILLLRRMRTLLVEEVEKAWGLRLEASHHKGRIPTPEDPGP